MNIEHSSEINNKKNYNKLYFTKKYKKNIDTMLYAFFIDADYENKTPYTILLTDNEIMNVTINLYTNITNITIRFIKQVTKLIEVFKFSTTDHIFRRIYDKYKDIINKYIKEIDYVLYKNNKFCNYKVNISTNTFFIPTMIDYLPYYELNMSNKNIDIIYIFPGINIIFNPKNLKLEIILKDKKKDIIYYKFLITPAITIDINNKINKKYFCCNLNNIKNFKNTDSNDINNFLAFLDDQKSYLPLIFF